MKKVSIANIIISIIIVIIAGVLFYNNRYNISNDMDNTEMYVMLKIWKLMPIYNGKNFQTIKNYRMIVYPCL